MFIIVMAVAFVTVTLDAVVVPGDKVINNKRAC